jgi:hypothetical protein
VVDGMIGDSRQHVAQVELWVETVEFGAADQAVDRGGALDVCREGSPWAPANSESAEYNSLANYKPTFLSKSVCPKCATDC